MRQIIREARAIRTLEMAPLSAFELLKKEGHTEQCQMLEAVEGNLVEVIEIGSFHQLSEGPHLDNTGQLAAFKLLSLTQLSDEGIRIQGAAAFSKEDLKKFLKLLAAFEKENYRQIGQQKGFWKCWDEGLVWLERGLEARRQVQNLFFQEAPFVEFSGDFDPMTTFFRRDYCQLKRGSFPDLRHSCYAIQKTNFSPPEDFLKRIISSLHSIYKILIMLGFDCWVRTCGNRRDWKGVIFPDEMKVERIEGAESCIEIMVEDSILRPIRIVLMKRLKKTSESAVVFVCEAFVERILALLLEKNMRIPDFPENLNRGK